MSSRTYFEKTDFNSLTDNNFYPVEEVYQFDIVYNKAYCFSCMCMTWRVIQVIQGSPLFVSELMKFILKFA